MEQWFRSLPKTWSHALIVASKVLAIFVATWLITKIVRAALQRTEKRMVEARTPKEGPLSEEARRVQTLLKLLRQFITVVIWALSGLVILSEIGINIGPLLASAGIFGLAVGFGAQNLVRDVISGFFLLIEDQVRVGDAAIINGTAGIVEKITLRTIALRDPEGTLHIFPHGTVTTLANRSTGWSAYVAEVGVAYKEDVDRVIGIIRRTGEEIKDDPQFGPFILEPIEVLGLDRFADSAVIIKVRLKTKPLKQWEIGREFNRRLKAAFDKEGVEIPFPHVSLYAGEATKPIPIRVLGPEKEV